MNKTLHKDTNKKSLKFYSPQLEASNGDEMLTEMMHHMKGYLQEAARDVLHPRPEAILQLLKKAGI